MSSERKLSGVAMTSAAGARRPTVLLCSMGLVVFWGCAHARQSTPAPKVVYQQVSTDEPSPSPTAETTASQLQAAIGQPPHSAPATVEERKAQLTRLIQKELAQPFMAQAKISLLAVPAGGGEPLFSLEPDARRVPASNAKLLTTTAAALTLPGHYRFVTEVSRSGQGGHLYFWGTGDPLLSRADLVRLAASLKARGINRVKDVIVDDHYFDRQRLAPGFESFSEGSYYRPTSGALNVDGNAIVIQVSAPSSRKRPRVDVFPPSDYVIVRKLVRYTQARKGPAAQQAKIQVTMQPRGSIMWLTISGTMGRRARPWSTRRAVYDPSLNVGWAFRRALMEAGLGVTGTVRRGRRPARAKVLARRGRSLGQILLATNRDSNNLCAETLIRAMSFLGHEGEDRRAPPGSWSAGLTQLREALTGIGLTDYFLGNGSGLHRRSWVSTRLMVNLLRTIYTRQGLREVLLPTLAIAGRAGTLAPRMRDTAAAGFVKAKTGTLGGALALSGFIDPDGEHPLIFSILVNGRSDHQVRDGMDRMTTWLARHARGLPLTEEAEGSNVAAPPTTTEPVEPDPLTEEPLTVGPATQPATSPSSAPASNEDRDQ